MEIEIPSKADSIDGTSLIFRKQELLEFSICNVPANPFALARKEQITGNKEQGTERNEKSDFSIQYWGGLISNLQGENYGE